MKTPQRKPPTPKQFAAAMDAIDDNFAGDIEIRHSKMDALMAETLEDLGYTDGVKLFTKATKWYA